MRIGKGNGLARLRRWRRAICSALLPVFGLWALTAPVCFAASVSAGGQTSQAAVHGDHSLDTHAHHGTAHEHSSPAPAAAHCPHCPPAPAADTSTSVCVVGATATASAPQKTAAFDSSTLIVTTRFVAILSPHVPHLRYVGATDPARYRTHVPLNIRHCVLLV